jgi:hypothetical protein
MAVPDKHNDSSAAPRLSAENAYGQDISFDAIDFGSYLVQLILFPVLIYALHAYLTPL